MKFLLTKDKFDKIYKKIYLSLSVPKKDDFFFKSIVKASIIHLYIGNYNNRKKLDTYKSNFLSFIRNSFYYDLLYITIAISYLLRSMIRSNKFLKSSVLFLVTHDYHYNKILDFKKKLTKSKISTLTIKNSNTNLSKNTLSIKNCYDYYAFFQFICLLVKFRFFSLIYLMKRNKKNPYDLWFFKYLPLMILKYSQCNYLNRKYEYKLLMSIDPTDPLIKLLEIINLNSNKKESICFPLGFVTEGDPYWLYDHNIYYGIANFRGTNFLKNEKITKKEIVTIGDLCLNKKISNVERKNKKSVVFFSSPSRKSLRDGGEFQVTKDNYLKILKSIINISIQNNLKLIIKLHPQDNNIDAINKLLKSQENLIYEVNESIVLKQIFKQSLIAFGFKSNVFFESIINSLPYLVIDIEEKQDYFEVENIFYGVYSKSIMQMEKNFYFFKNNRHKFYKNWNKSVTKFLNKHFPSPLNQSSERALKLSKKILKLI